MIIVSNRLESFYGDIFKAIIFYRDLQNAYPFLKGRFLEMIFFFTNSEVESSTCTDIHLTLQLHSHLYSEGFHRGLCSYITKGPIQRTFYDRKNKVEMFSFMASGSIF